MPLRRLFATLAVALWMLLPLQASAQSTETAVASDISSFWAGQFANNGYSYSAPGFVAIYAEVSTGCGPVDPYMLGPAAYCPVDSTIYVAPAWEAVYGPEEWVTIISHEWGHHVQHLLGQNGYPSDESELQADCLAGAYVADAQARGTISPGVFNHGMGTSIRSGEPPFLPDDAGVHGTGAERGGSYMGGYMTGIGACGIF